MIPATFDYARATSLDDALKAAARADTMLICGGQSLIPLLRFRLAQPVKLVDIAHVDELHGISRTDEAIHIGAATTYRELLDSELLRQALPLIAEVTNCIADRQVRNVGTFGGGLAHADPAADMPAAMLALDATMVLRSRRATRDVPAAKFFRGPFVTAKRSNELLMAIRIPVTRAGTAYETFQQLASGYPLVGVAAAITRADGKIVEARLAFTGLADKPFLSKATRTLIGTDGNAKLVAAAAKRAAGRIQPNVDIHASAEYRLHLAAVAARRALSRAIERS